MLFYFIFLKNKWINKTTFFLYFTNRESVAIKGMNHAPFSLQFRIDVLRGKPCFCLFSNNGIVFFQIPPLLSYQPICPAPAVSACKSIGNSVVFGVNILWLNTKWMAALSLEALMKVFGCSLKWKVAAGFLWNLVLAFLKIFPIVNC